MKLLEPDRIALRYADLVALGRSRLPGLAPSWTDHNPHDPGITLMELLASVTEAQLYALGRMRRDVRDAYSTLFAVQPGGARPARGLLWPDRSRPDAPANLFKASVAIDADARVRLRDSPEPEFRPLCKLLWAPGTITRLWQLGADGTRSDFTALNARGAGFSPFGKTAGARDVLTMDFVTHASQGIFPTDPTRAAGARWTIGVRARNDSMAMGGSMQAADHPVRPGLVVTLVAETARYDVPVIEDTSLGMLRSGVLLLDLSAVRGSPVTFSLEFRAPRGLPRAPHVLRIEPNVVPVTQSSRVVEELHVANGRPDFSFDLNRPGLCYEPGGEPVALTSGDGADARSWARCRDLSEQGPQDRVFALDATGAQLRLGNGVNGLRPSRDEHFFASYSVCDGAQGNVARHRQWLVGGIAGIFGSNPDPVAGGAVASDRQEMRRQARVKLAEGHALVSASDIQTAAGNLPVLEVARTWMAPRTPVLSQAATLRLIAMRARSDGDEAVTMPETRRWLEAIRRALAPRIPLGLRLLVSAPRYVRFSVNASVVVEKRHDPAGVERDVRAELALRMRLVSTRRSDKVRAPGVAVTLRDAMAWLLAVQGVAEVRALELLVDGRAVAAVKVPLDGLPSIDLQASAIACARPQPGGRA